MSVLKAVVSFYRTGEERPSERYKARLKVQEEHRTLSAFKKNVIDFLGLNEQARKFGLGQFDLKLYRLAKISGKIENYSLSTQQQLDLELPLLLDSDSESELNKGVSDFRKRLKANPVKYEAYKQKERKRKQKVRKKEKKTAGANADRKRKLNRQRVRRFRARKKKEVEKSRKCGIAEPVYKTPQALGKAISRVKPVLQHSPWKRKAVVMKLAAKKMPVERSPNCIPAETVKLVESFFLLDSVSRQAPGKQDFVTVRVNGKKQQMQKRHLLWSLEETYALFKKEHSLVKIGLTLIPRFVCLGSVTNAHSGLRLCLIEEDLNLMVTWYQWERVVQKMDGKESYSVVKRMEKVASALCKAVKVSFISSEELDKSPDLLDLSSCFQEAPAIPGISKYHCIEPQENGQIRFRIYSSQPDYVELGDQHKKSDPDSEESDNATTTGDDFKIKTIAWERFERAVGIVLAREIWKEGGSLWHQDIVNVPCNSFQSEHWFALVVMPKKKQMVTLDSKAGDFVKPTIHDALLKMGSFLVELGVCGSGKELKIPAPLLTQGSRNGILLIDSTCLPLRWPRTTVARALAKKDRQPWLLALHKVIERWSKRSESGVLACSALKEQYRQTILFGAEASSDNPPYCSNGDKRQKLSKPSPFYCLVVLLQGSKDVVRERMEKRQEHFMPLSLLDSQFETLEEPVTCDEYSALHVSVDQTVEEIINDILRTLKAKCGVKVSIHSTV
ncbi:putative gluconokinase [Stylophora pistillata]|uniref:gluconokinase n=1 Tax=Stylophora pistillata TaxID=50429 RepID=A0A2B4SGW1_STYPI|nr:putative gluconokinase [Stylophora pistillata]